MNCKPGDLAVVVSGEPAHNIGKMVQVKTLHRWVPGIWLFEGNLTNEIGLPLLGVADNCLRPIRDPGTDAVDETLVWKKVPAPQLGEPA